MYEFLAPWGVLVPALSAALIYLVISEKRRKRMLGDIEAPEGAPPQMTSRMTGSRLA